MYFQFDQDATQKEMKMLLVLGPYPNKQNEKDGMLQRVAAIDSLMGDAERVYVSSLLGSQGSFLRHPKKFIKSLFSINKYTVNNNVSVYQSISQAKLKHLAQKADLIYIHSLYSACLLDEELISLFSHKIIMDIHGCVVEELAYQNQALKKVDQFKKVESLIFNNISTLVSVSDNMTQFYKDKYPNCKANFIKFPIFNFQNIERRHDDFSEKSCVIYSGGTQKWQNVELMMDSIAQQKDNFTFLILTPDIDYFDKIIQASNRLSTIELKSVEPHKVSQEYKSAHFGFILRDDIIVNQVACPTKLIEYLESGLIPIVLQPEIGDFNQMGYNYILNENFVKGLIPEAALLKEIRESNYKIIETLQNEKMSAIQQLKRYFV